jgi:hypothetical protein
MNNVMLRISEKTRMQDTNLLYLAIYKIPFKQQKISEIIPSSSSISSDISQIIISPSKKFYSIIYYIKVDIKQC